MPDKIDKFIEHEKQRQRTRYMVGRIIAGAAVGDADLVRPHMRPHTLVFLRQKDNGKVSVIPLGIVFKTWDRAKFNMIRFTAQTYAGKEVATSGRLTVLENGENGIVLDVRWPWTTLLKEFKGLSAGDL